MVSGWEEALSVTMQVTRVLDRLGVPYVIGGSIASSIYGPPRSTQDVDVVADLRDEHVSPFVAALQNDFYLDEAAVREAVRRQWSFNVIHLQTTLKVDVFIAKQDLPTAQEFARRQRYVPQHAPDAELSSPARKTWSYRSCTGTGWETMSRTASGWMHWAC